MTDVKVGQVYRHNPTGRNVRVTDVGVKSVYGYHILYGNQRGLSLSWNRDEFHTDTKNRSTGFSLVKDQPT